MRRTKAVGQGLAALALVALAAGCGGGEGIDAGAPPGVDVGVDASSADALVVEDAPGLDVGDAGDRADAGEVVAVADVDRDDDGVPDALDAFPDDPLEWDDADGDGIGNLAEADEDGDGTPDARDERPFDASAASYRTLVMPGAAERPSRAAPVGAPPARFRVVLGGGADPEEAYVSLGLDGLAGVTVLLEGAGADIVEVLALERGVVLYAHRDEVRGTSRSVSFAPESADLVLGFELAGRVGPRRTLDVVVVQDADLDGLDDDREHALGLRGFDPDTDHDGLGDGDELVADLDPDADGAPSFLDPDSDGDGLADRDEGIVDDDGDGAAAFVDTDSDGDGMADAGADPFADLDADGRADFLDVDDDGDGLRDATDASPRTPLTVDLDPRMGIVIESVASALGASLAPDAIVPGETLVLSGSGLDGAGAELVVFGVGGAAPVSATPTSVGATSIRVVAPPGAASPIRVVRGALASEPFAATVVDLAAGQPLLFEQPAPTTWPAPLLGRNLERIVRIRLGARSVAPIFDGPIASIGAEGSGPLRVESLDGTSNEVPLRMSMPGTAIALVMPLGSSLDPSTFVVSSTLEDAPDPAGGPYFAPPVSHPVGAELVSAIRVDGLGPGRDCMALATFSIDGVATSIDAASTATTLGLVHTGALARVHPSSAEALRGRVSGLSEAADVAALIAARLAADDPCPLDRPDAAMRDAVLALSAAVVADLEAGLADGTFTAAGMSSYVRPLFPLRTATITPEQFDVAVLQTARTENVEIENDTSMSLSARITTSPGGDVLVPHVTGFFDRGVIGGQSGILTGYRAATQTYDQPRARNSRIEVITPGFAEPSPTDPAAREAQWIVAFRTAVEGLLLPALDAVVPDVKASWLLHLILQQGYSAALDARSAYDAGDLPGFAGAVVNILLRDLDNVGPITQGLARLAGGAVSARLSRRLAARLVPIVGQIATIVDLGASAASVTNIGKVMVDLGTTPGVLVYDVDFGFAVSGVEPAVLERAHRPATVTIRGAGFWALDAGRRVRPRVHVRDGGTGAERTYEVSSITQSGTELEVVIPGAFMASAGGPLFFAVDRGGEVMEHPLGVPVEQELRIVSSSPEPIGAGQRLLLSGAGYGPDPRRVRVWFYGVDETGMDIQLRARVVEHTHHELAVITPSALAPERAWEVEVDVTDPAGALLTSNRHPLNVRCIDLANSVWEMTVTYDLCSHPRVNHILVAFDRFVAPWAPGGGDGAVYLETTNPVLVGAPIGLRRACLPTGSLYLGEATGGLGPQDFPPSVEGGLADEPAYPSAGIASPDGRTFRWFTSYLEGCSGALGNPLVPNRVVMRRRE